MIGAEHGNGRALRPPEVSVRNQKYHGAKGHDTSKKDHLPLLGLSPAVLQMAK
jgi:hypothetical protein